MGFLNANQILQSNTKGWLGWTTPKGGFSKQCEILVLGIEQAGDSFTFLPGGFLILSSLHPRTNDIAPMFSG
jgi:hypothetical protein